MGFISGALVLWGETLLMKEVPSTETGVIFATEPVWAAAFAAALLNEAVTPQELAGGGAIEMELSKHLREHSRSIFGKDQLLINAYAKALEVIPRQLCENAGFDATDLLNKLRMKHAQWA